MMSRKQAFKQTRDKPHKAKPYERPKSLLSQVASTVRDYLIPSWLLNISGRYAPDPLDDPQPSTSRGVEHDSVSERTLKRAALNENVTNRSECVIPFKRSDTFQSASRTDSSDTPDIDVVSEDVAPTVSETTSQREVQRDESEFRIPTVLSSWTSHNLRQSESSRTRQLELASSTCRQGQPKPSRTGGDAPTISNGDDQSEKSDASASTSGCSSLVPSDQEGRLLQPPLVGLNVTDAALEQLRKELCEKRPLLSQKKQDASGENETRQESSFLERSSSLRQTSTFLEDSRVPVTRQFSKPQPVVQGRRPSFSLAPFGASASLDRTTFSAIRNSPFYKGKTSYGGASAHRKARLCASPYQTVRPVNIQTRAREVRSQQNEDNCLMTSTAKQILQTLEKMSSPLTDAKKIPHGSSKPVDVMLSFKPPSARWRTAVMVPKTSQSSPGPPVAPIRTPAEVKIAPNLEPIVRANLEKMSKDQRQNRDESRTETSISFGTSETPSLGGFNSFKSGGKIRARINQTCHLSSRPDPENEVIEEPDLPSIPLPITNLPKFSFAPTFLTASPSATVTSVTQSPGMQPGLTKMSSMPNNKLFTFSVPIHHPLPSTADPAPMAREQEFNFREPVCKEEALHETNKRKSDSMFQYEAAQASFAVRCVTSSASGVPKSADKSTTNFPASFSSPKDSSIVKPAGELIIGGSVMDILGKSKPIATKSMDASLHSSSVMTNSVSLQRSTVLDQQKRKVDNQAASVNRGFGDQFKPLPGSWECATCLIWNNSSQDKCMACECPRSITAGPSGKSSINADKPKSTVKGFGEQFKPPQGSWECNTCLVQNDSSHSKCMACEMPKGGTTTHKSGPTSSNKFDTIKDFKPPSDSWECTVCLVRNKASDSKCVCCEALKPGGQKQLETPGFGNLFKPPPDSWLCPTCMINNSNSLSKCSACETPKPGATSSVAQTTMSSQSSISSSGNTSSFLDKFRPPSGTWECDTCLVRNKEDTSKCVACETPRIGVNAAAEKKGSTFKFGVPSKDTTSTFKFGIPSTAATTSSAAGFASLITTTAPAPPSTASSSGGFKFGVPSASDSPSQASTFKMPATTSITPALPTVSFGIPKTTSSVSDTKTNTSTTSFKFGSPSVTDSSKSATFSFSKPSNNSNQPQKPFGASTTVSNIAFNAATPFAFGSPINHGTSKPTESAPASLPVFGSPSESDKTSAPTSQKQPALHVSSSAISLFPVKETSASFALVPKAEVHGTSTETPADKTAVASFTAAPSAHTTTLPTGTFSFNKPTTTSSFLPTSTLLSTAASTTNPAAETFSSTSKLPPTTVSSSVPAATFSFGFASAAARSSEKPTSKPEFPINRPSKEPDNVPSVQSTFSFLKNNPAKPANTSSSAAASIMPSDAVSTFKFGDTTATTTPSSSTSSANTFVFGTRKTEPTTGSGGGFQFCFGAPIKSDTGVAPKEPTFGGFGASQTPVASLTTQPPSVALFGTAVASTAPSLGSSTTGMFSFGAPPNQAISTKFPPETANTATTTTASMPLLFGNTPAVASSAVQPGGFGITATPAFGQTAPDKKPEGNKFPITMNPSSGFGSMASPGVFQFGTTPQEQPSSGPLAPPTGFSFGGAQNANVGANSGFSFTPSTTPNFNFTQTGQVGNFNFSAMPNDNPFNATSTNSSSTRKIKRAVRRIGRKTNE